MKRETLGAWVFLLTAVFCVIAALIPVFRGRPMNVTFVAIGGFWLIIGLAVAAKARKGSGTAGDHIQ